ncbi:MAG TPA: zinc metallopeptidase [Anaerolineae bacterium]|nr:zinc metallopeptidase [Anaerolineae bacterium]
MFFDPMYFVFVLPALLLAFYAQMKVRGAYSKWLKVANARGLSGLDAARYLLSSNQLGDVAIEGAPGELTDHYDPRTRTLRLSQGVANSRSVASLAIVAHEVGHAVQDAVAYAPLKFRGAIVPAIQLSSWVGPLLFFIGLLIRSTELAWLGVFFFGGTALFALVTLPVELNASSRAIAMLRNDGLVTNTEEESGARSVLNAAALTYIAALAQTLMTLLYYVSILAGDRRR